MVLKLSDWPPKRSSGKGVSGFSRVIWQKFTKLIAQDFMISLLVSRNKRYSNNLSLLQFSEILYLTLSFFPNNIN